MDNKNMTNVKESLDKINFFRNIIRIIENLILIFCLILLVFITFHIVYQKIVYPDTIPDIFGYKMFMIFDDYMDESIEYGDLVITSNVNTNKLRKNDLIAFRNEMDTVTIHKINDIQKVKEEDKENNKINTVRFFLMNTLENEKEDTTNVREDRVEGIIVYRIAKLGSIIYFIQKPKNIISIMIIFVMIGVIMYCIAYGLDERDRKALSN